MSRLNKQLQTLYWLIFYLALGFYFQRQEQPWGVYLSFGCLLLAALLLLKKRRKD